MLHEYENYSAVKVASDDEQVKYAMGHQLSEIKNSQYNIIIIIIG